MTDSPCCPVCDGGRSEHYKDTHGCSMFTCQDCGTVYMFPQPTAEVVEEMYHDAYHGASTVYFAKVKSKMRRSRRRIKRLTRMASGGRFLDIGCNAGFAVEAAREFGYTGWGIDLDPVSIRYAAEHYPENHFQRISIEDMADLDSTPRFDVVYCSEVIEHVPRVNRFVAAIARVMNPGGVLYVTTPDITHWRRPRDVEKWDAFGPPSHCIFFRPDSLKGLLARHGLEVFRKDFAPKPTLKMYARKV